MLHIKALHELKQKSHVTIIFLPIFFFLKYQVDLLIFTEVCVHLMGPKN